MLQLGRWHDAALDAAFMTSRTDMHDSSGRDLTTFRCCPCTLLYERLQSSLRTEVSHFCNNLKLPTPERSVPAETAIKACTICPGASAATPAAFFHIVKPYLPSASPASQPHTSSTTPTFFQYNFSHVLSLDHLHCRYLLHGPRLVHRTQHARCRPAGPGRLMLLWRNWLQLPDRRER
jgi:hypothetical protein